MHLRCAALAGAAAILAAILLTGEAARAQAPSARDPVAAEALFREARQELTAGRYAEACPKFAESLRLDPALGTLLNLAECEEHDGKVASAWEHWRQGLDRLPAGDPRIAMAQQHFSALEPRLPRLTLQLAAGAPDDTRVLRDGVELGRATFGIALPVDPGDHVLTILAANHEAATKPVHLDAAQSLTVQVEPGALGATPPPAPMEAVPPPPSVTPSAHESSNGLRTAGWVVGGVGIASFVGAAVTGILIVGDKSTANTDCTPEPCTHPGVSAVDGGKTLLAVNAVTWALGIAGVGAGVTMILVGGGHGEKPGGSVTASISPGPGGFVFQGTFR
jgi:hypothetical protein